MTVRPDPFDKPEWHALGREAKLVRQLIGAGATALGRASYADGFGEYYTAFFSLSIGIERLAKMILIADYVLDHNGALPDQGSAKKYGHNLSKLIDLAGEIAEKHNLQLQHKKPGDDICEAIISCLNAFADSSKVRYANYQAIGNPSFDTREEPVAKWWWEVVEPILTKHYRGKRTEIGVKSRAKIIDALMGSSTMLLHFDEQGNTMSDVETASERTGQTKFAQKYGRFYTLVVVRWLANIFTELTQTNGYQPGLEILFGHYEQLNTYRTEDSFLLTRKNWP